MIGKKEKSSILNTNCNLEFKRAEMLPDTQNGSTHPIQGAHVPLAHVGISEFKLPIKIKSANGNALTLETTVNGSVNLKADNKGIHMSRLVRKLYEYEDYIFDINTLEDILKSYKKELSSNHAFIKFSFNYPIKQTSLKSNIAGYQYYKCSYEAEIDEHSLVRRFISFDFEYSSSCPCSTELTEHSLKNNRIPGIPHSQRSLAKVKIELSDNAILFIEDLQKHCLQALQTETQVMVKREDEQSFAQLNYINQKFVEDAVRLLYKELNADNRILDFTIHCTHFESLHSHNAIASTSKGIPDGLIPYGY